jgi:cytochrome P450
MFALGFAMPYIRSLEDIIDSRYALLRRQMDQFARTGEAFDLRHYITYCIVDILGELAFDQAFDDQIDCDPDMIPPVSDALWSSIIKGQVPWLARILNFLTKNVPFARPPKALTKGRDRIIQLSVQNIKACTANPDSSRKDILGLIMNAQEEKTGNSLTFPQMITESVTLIIGGTHTTSNAIQIFCKFESTSGVPEAIRSRAR